MGDVYEFEMSDYSKGGMEKLYGLVAYITAELKDIGLATEDVYEIIEDILRVKLLHESVWEETIRQLLDEARSNAESDSPEDFRKSITAMLEDAEEE